MLKNMLRTEVAVNVESTSEKHFKIVKCQTIASNLFSMSLCILQVWTYEDGEVIFVGIGHSAPIKKAKICPNQRYIVSVSADGAILVWKFPQEPRIK